MRRSGLALDGRVGSHLVASCTLRKGTSGGVRISGSNPIARTGLNGRRALCEFTIERDDTIATTLTQQLEVSGTRL
jgi:hypothetical protein